MSLRRRRHKPESGDLELTTFLNVLVVLMSFLLLSAVFSRIAIQELKLPTASADAVAEKPAVTVEVIVRAGQLEIGDGRRVVAASAKAGDHYDLLWLSDQLQQLKTRYTDKTDAMLLVEPEVAYDDVIRVIDAIKTVRVEKPVPGGKAEIQLVSLFPDVSIGDAP